MLIQAISVRKDRKIHCDKCKRQVLHHKDIDSIISICELSARTVRKILKRMHLPCSRCNWNEDVGDIHHIRGKKIPDANNHNNLAYLCPNCHRLAGNKKIPIETLKNLQEYIGDSWKRFYFKSKNTTHEAR